MSDNDAKSKDATAAQEQERKERVHLHFQVVYDDGENFMAGPVIDVSETGMYIETVMPLDPGTKVRITPLLPEEDGLFEFEAEVMRKKDENIDEIDRIPGMGLRFTNIDPQDLKALKALIAAQAEKEKATE